MTERNQMNEDNEPKDGSRLADALRAQRRASVFIPPAVDASVLARARPHLARIRPQRSLRRRTQWLALAACVAVFAVIAQMLFHRTEPSSTFAREDLNHDGRVDILDAFQLAREIKRGQPLVKTGDFNGDGKVDSADVEILAKRAVKLEKGGPS
jgi:hypothetical protein